MTSNHTTEPSEEEREAAALHFGYKSKADMLYWGRSAEWTAIEELAKSFAAHRLRALSPSPDDRMGEVAAAWQRVSDELDSIEGGMHAGLEDAASDMWAVVDAATTRLAASREGGGHKQVLEDVRVLIIEASDPRDRHELLTDALARIEAALASPAPMPEITEAARALVEKLDECKPHIEDAAMHRYLRCGDYTGPQ
jgi:hypothetical protein